MSGNAVALGALPKWTRRVAVEDGGRDPLGLSRVSGSITDYLLTGITSQTQRARYYSFYCWVLWHINSSEAPTSWKTFEEAFRRRDTLFATASLVYDKEARVVGVDAIKPRLQKAERAIEVECNYRALPSAYLGAFDQYYKGSLYNLGMWSSTRDGIFHATDKANIFAEAFHRTIENTPYIRKSLFLENSVSWKDLNSTKNHFNLERLNLQPVPEERALLTDLFFRDVTASGKRRQQTLALILDTIHSYEQGGGSLRSDEGLDWQLLFGPHYYDQLVWSGKARRYSPPAALADCHLMWRQFCLHEYLTRALEYLLIATLEALSGESRGLSAADISRRLFGADLNSSLKKLHGRKCASPNELFKHIGIDTVPDPKTCQDTQKRLNSSHSSSEDEVLDRGEIGTPAELSAVALSVLVVLYAKWRAVLPRETQRLAGTEVWALPVLASMDKWWTSPDWTVAADSLYTFVLQQHDKVMFEKGLLKRWLDFQDGKYIKEQDYDAEWRNSRHQSCIGILSDLGMIEVDAERTVLTAYGRKTLHSILEQ